MTSNTIPSATSVNYNNPETLAYCIDAVAHSKVTTVRSSRRARRSITFSRRPYSSQTTHTSTTSYTNTTSTHTNSTHGPSSSSSSPGTATQRLGGLCPNQVQWGQGHLQVLDTKRQHVLRCQPYLLRYGRVQDTGHSFLFGRRSCHHLCRPLL